MTTELSTKVVKVNFKDIIDNCLDKEYWEKKWLIFEYDNYQIRLYIAYIIVVAQKIELRVELKKEDSHLTHNQNYYLPLNQYNQSVFCNSLLRAVHEAIVSAERSLGRSSDRYQELVDLDTEIEAERKKELAEYLDEIGVKELDVRETYIESKLKTSNLAFEYLKECENDLLSHLHRMADVMIEFEGE